MSAVAGHLEGDLKMSSGGLLDVDLPEGLSAAAARQ